MAGGALRDAVAGAFRRRAATASRPAALAAERQLLASTRASIRPTRTLTGRETIGWRNITARPTVSELQLSPVLERLAGHAIRRGCASGALAGIIAPAARLSRDGGRPGSSTAARRAVDGADTTCSTSRRAAVHRPGRRQCRRPDGDGASAARRRCDPESSVEIELDVDGARAAHVRAHRRHRQLLLHRAVVSEARRARGRGLEHASVPRAHRVLLGLRRLRRAASPCPRAGSSAPRGFERRAPTTPTARRPTATTRTTSTTSRGRRAPTSSIEPARFERSNAAAGRDAAAAAAGARAAGRSPFRRGHAPTLKYYGEWFGPIRTATSPSSIRRTRAERRHGVPDARSRRDVAADRARATSSTPEAVTIHEAGHQFWYGIVGTNEFEHAWMDEGLNTFSTARAMEQDVRRHFSRSATSAASSRGCSGTSGCAAKRCGIGCRAIGRRAEGRRAVDADVPLLAGDRPLSSPTTRPRCG